MAAKLVHLHSSTPAAVPAAVSMDVGRIAINHADKKLFILDGNGNVVVVGDAAYGTVKSVNSVSPNTSGALTLAPADLGATATGTSLFTSASASAARTTLGATTVGSALFTATDAPTALTAIGGVATSQIGAANGVAPLGPDSKISTSYLPSSILGNVNFQGPYDASTNTPAIADAATANKGWFYIASSAGTYTPTSGSPVVLNSGDWIISNGTSWSRLDANDEVTSVAGRVGAIVLSAADIASGTFVAARLGATSGNSLVLTTSAAGAPTWATTIPAANLPLATTTTAGAMIVGAGLAVASGLVTVDTANLTLNEGTF